MSFTDYSNELRISRSKPLRVLYFILGWFSLVFSIIGIFLPGWPTTIWAILATYFFMRSSKKFYNYIMNHRVMGPLIQNWRSGRGMTVKTKVAAIITSNTSIAISIYLIPIVWIKFLLLMIALSLTTYFLTLPTFTPRN